MSERIGLECKLYRGTSLVVTTPDLVSWEEITAARDVTINLDATEANITSRGNAGWKKTRQALKDGSLDFELIWDPDDPNVEAVRDAYLNRTPIALAAMDGDIAVSTNEGFVSNWYITAFSRAEPLEEAVTVSVTAKPCDKQQWYEVA